MSDTTINIALTGFMGTGKSSVAKQLAALRGARLLDTDTIIEQESGMSISQIFENFGEARFRELERRVVEELAGGLYGDDRSFVVSTGGGIVIDPESRKKLKAFARVVCLTATPEEILKRVEGGVERPLLSCDNPAEEIERLLQERNEFYADCDLTIDTTGKNLAEIVDEIEEFLIG